MIDRKDHAPIATIAVVGGGIVGWSAAAAIKRRLPDIEVHILSIEPPAGALTEHITATMPSINRFHADLGLADEDAVIRSNASFRLGTLFSGWNATLPDYVHSYGAYGCPLPAGSFHQHWLRAHEAGAAPPFDTLSAASALGRAGRFAPPTAAGRDPFGRYDYGLSLDLDRYRAMMIAFARHVGVVEETRRLRAVEQASGEWISGLTLDEGTRFAADLYIDCTGPAARLRALLDDECEDWRHWLPCDRVIVGTGPGEGLPSPLDTVTAGPAGWRWSADAGRRTSQGVVYAAAQCDDEEAAQQLARRGAREIGTPITIEAGTRRRPWLGNCVAIGDAATVIEPLEWSGLHLCHHAIDRIVTMLPDRSCAAVETMDYNRRAYAEAQRVRDFVLLHYAASDRPEPFWRQWGAIDLPDTLAHSLTLFRDRGRLPFYEEESFTRDSWLAVLIGQGVRPRRIDPLIDAFPAPQSARLIRDWQAAIAAGVAARPSLAAFLNAQYRHVMQ